MLGGIFKIKGIWLIFLALILGGGLMLIPDNSVSTGSPAFPSAEEYRISLEKQAEKLIESIDGVGDCTVMISLESGYEYVYASDQTLTRTYDENGVLLSTASTKEYVLDGEGKSIIISETPPKIEGIGVVAKNASQQTAYRIVRLLQGVYGIPSNRITVES